MHWIFQKLHRKYFMNWTLAVSAKEKGGGEGGLNFVDVKKIIKLFHHKIKKIKINDVIAIAFNKTGDS